MIKTIKAKKGSVIFIAILILGFILRLYLSSLSYKTLLWDMQSYANLAGEIYQGHWAVDCCSKNAGYSLFIASIYRLFGFENLDAVRIANIIFDLLTAVFIFKIVLSRWGKKSAWLSFILYVGNPLTSSYTGLILAENITLFFVSALALLITKKGFLNKPLYWFFFGLILGLLVLLRFSLLSFCLSLIILFTVLVFRKRAFVFFILSCAGFFLTSFYSLVGNYRQFKLISLIPPYNPGIMAFYSSFYQTKRYPELVSQYPSLDKDYYRINLEYYTTNYPWIPQLKEKYKNLFWQKIRTDWPILLQNTIRNKFYIWDKDHLSAYTDPFYPKDRWFIRSYNLILLFLFGVGLVETIFREKRKILADPLVLFTLLLFFYITFAVTLVSNESRHSLLFYTFIFIWAGYGGKVISRTILSCTTIDNSSQMS
ncbi:glycosyltransferase family 39 protein [Candidatus Microgenomates bacterium]|nr:glycosyltransferase family 39 protein [Candidatus Microgenomates bacterium]